MKKPDSKSQGPSKVASKVPKPHALPKTLQGLNVAIVQDWLVGGGAERVVAELHTLFPEAPIYSSYCTPEWRERLDNKVVTGWLQHFGRVRKFMGLGRIWWFSHLDLSSFDLVISVTGNGEAKGIRTTKNTTHVCYCHTPVHYYWRHYQQYMDRPGFGFFDPLARLGLRLLVGPLRRWDLRASKQPDFFIANSTHIQADIKTYYGRDSVVIHPPIDITRFAVPEPKKRQGFIAASRQVPAKRFDIIIEACNKLQLPLTVIGQGPEHKKLVEMAGPTINFPESVSDQAMATYMASAQAFLFASFEDFGVTPVEALAAGTPVLAYHAGGALDYVVPGKTGEFFSEQTVESLCAALKKLKPEQYNHREIQKAAEQFSPEQFDKKLLTYLASLKKNRRTTCCLTIHDVHSC